MFGTCSLQSVRVQERADQLNFRHQFAQQLHPLRIEFGAERAHPCDVAARPVETGNEPATDWIGNGREDNRYCRSCCLGRHGRNVAAGREDHSDATADQLSGQPRQPLILIFGPAEFDRDVLAFDEAAIFEGLAENGDLVQEPARRRAISPASRAAAPAPPAATPLRRRPPSRKLRTTERLPCLGWRWRALCGHRARTMTAGGQTRP
jgi:hypothetical protein